MQRWMEFLATIICVCSGVVGCTEPAPVEPVDDPLESFCGDDSSAVEDRIDQLLGELSLEQKASLMHGITVLPLGGTWETTSIEELGIPGFHMIDGPRGVSAFAGHATAFPVASARGASWSPELEGRIGAMIGREARALGADVILAPTINVLRHPRWGRSQETYGEDPFHIGAMAVAFIRGAQQHVVASVKHFAVNSIEDTRFDVNITVDERTLREVYLPGFRRAVQDAQVGSVMSAYNRVNGRYCAENGHLLNDILRDEWRFSGFVVSDWYQGTRSTVPSAEAGLDVEMPVGNFYGQPIVDAVEAGELDEALVDAAVRHVLRVQLCFDLDGSPPVEDPTMVETSEATELALEAAQRSIVLLRNSGGLLPIDGESEDLVVVIGPLADVENIGDMGSSRVSPSEVVTPLEGLQNRAGGLSIELVTGDPAEPDVETAITAADVVILVVGLTSADEGEAVLGDGDRAALALPIVQVTLIEQVTALNDSVVVVIEGGSVITMEDWLEEVEAVVMAWYPGVEGGHAIADVLFGEVNPSGRLPVVLPVSESDLPPFDNESLEVTYERDHGYRYLDRFGTEALFPFGYGLSYTSFAYDDLRLARNSVHVDGTITATVDITNTGERAGIETVQLYVSAQGSRVDRHVRTLAAFAQVELEPGETRMVILEVPSRELAFYDVETSAWEVETIDYRLGVGPNAGDLPLEATVTIVSGEQWSAE